jgi:hypothetical protein
MALGAGAGPVRWDELFRANGCERFALALEIPFALVTEARP